MRKIIYAFLILISPASGLNHAYAQNTYYEVSNLFHEKTNAFACESVAQAIQEIKAKNEEQIKGEIGETVDQLSSDEESSSELKKSLIQTQKTPMIKEKIIHGLEQICKVTREGAIDASRGVSLLNSAVLNTALEPVTSLISLLRGVFDRKRAQLGPRNDFLYRAMGPKKGIPFYILGNLASDAPFILLNASSAVNVIGLTTSIEMITNYRCYHENKLNPEQVKFCGIYSDLKDFLYQGNQKSFALGKKIQAWLDRKIIQKRAQLSVDDFCQFDYKEQMKRSREALKRYSIFKNPKISHTEIIPPFHKNTCTKILVQADKQADLDALQAEQSKVEGIEIVYLLKGIYPKDYYYTSEELSKMSYADQLCNDVMRVKYTRMTTSSMSMMGDLVKSALAQDMLAAPEHQEVVIPDSLLRKGTVSHLRNVVFSIGMSEQDQTDVKQLMDERKAIASQIDDDYKKIVRSEDFNQCKQNLKNLSIPLETFKTKLARVNEISATRSLQTYQEQQTVEQFFKKTTRFLKLRWELITTNDLQTVSKALASGEFGNIVVLSHGKADGHLVDSKQQEFPSEAFSNISPSILSLNFYSCHSNELPELYGINQKISTGPSFYKIRYLTTVKQNDFMNGDSYAPIAAFGDYLFQLDHFLNDSKKGADLLQKNFGSDFQGYQSPTMCTADFSQVHVDQGSYAVTLNDQYLGTLSSGDSSSKIEFPCSSLKGQDNSLKIKNILNAGGSSIANLEGISFTVGAQSIGAAQATYSSQSILIFNF